MGLQAFWKHAVDFGNRFGWIALYTSLLSTVAYFGLHVAWNGVLVNDSAMTTWNDASGPVPGLISTAHANGTKVVLTRLKNGGRLTIEFYSNEELEALRRRLTTH